MPTFRATIQLEGKSATGFRVPPEIVSGLGSHKRPPVRISINGYTYRSTVAPFADGVFMLPLSGEHREAAGVKAGDEVDITIELDTEPRTVDVPDDLAAALEAAGVRAKFDVLSHSARKEYARQVVDAKAQETRDRRIAGIVTKLTG